MIEMIGGERVPETTEEVGQENIDAIIIMIDIVRGMIVGIDIIKIIGEAGKGLNQSHPHIHRPCYPNELINIYFITIN